MSNAPTILADLAHLIPVVPATNQPGPLSDLTVPEEVQLLLDECPETSEYGALFTNDSVQMVTAASPHTVIREVKWDLAYEYSRRFLAHVLAPRQEKQVVALPEIPTAVETQLEFPFAAQPAAEVATQLELPLNAPPPIQLDSGGWYPRD